MAKIGRKPLRKEDRKSMCVQTYLTEKEHRAVTKAVRDDPNRITIAQFVRLVLLRAL